MALLVAATVPPRTAAQLFPFTSLRHIFDNLKMRSGGSGVARIHSEHDSHSVQPVAASTLIPSSSTNSPPTIFLVDPESQYRKIEFNQTRHFTPIPITASSAISEHKSPPLFKRSPALPPVPSSFLQPPPKDVPLRIDLSEVTKLAGEKVKMKQPDNTVASSVDVPKNHKLSPKKKLTNHRLENVPPNHKKKAPSINTPRKRPEKHQNPTAQADATVRVPSPNRLVRPSQAPAAPVVEPEQSASHLDVPEGGEDRVEFQMHGLQGPKSYKFGFDTGKGQHRQFRYEERDQHGYVRGHYGYVDDEGKLQVVNYKADPHTGYHADVSKLHL